MNRKHPFLSLLPLQLLLVVSLAATATASATASSLTETARLLAGNTAGSVVAGVDDWLFLKEDLAHLAAGRFWGESANAAVRGNPPADPIPAIRHYQQQLAERGITLYLMPVPPKPLVYADKLVPGLAASAAEIAVYEEFYQELAAAGVQVIDLLPTLLARRHEAELYCRTDSHFSGAGLELFAEAAAAAITAEGWTRQQPARTSRLREEELNIRGDLATIVRGEEAALESLPVHLVQWEGGGEVVPDPAGPVLLLGDSHTLVFHAGGDLHAKGAGLFEHLSARLGFAIDLLGVRGSGVTPARISLYQRLRQDPAALAGKKALIWCFAAREFSAGGWREIPLSR